MPRRTPAQLKADADECVGHLAMRDAELKKSVLESNRCAQLSSRAKKELAQVALQYVSTQPALLAVLRKCEGTMTVTARTPEATRKALRTLRRYRLVFDWPSTGKTTAWSTSHDADLLLAKMNAKKGLRMSTKTQTALNKARAAERKANEEASALQVESDEANEKSRVAWEAFFAAQERTRAARQEHALDRPGAWEFLRDIAQSGPDFAFAHPMPDETVEHLDALDGCGLLRVVWHARGCIVNITNEGAERAKHRLRRASWVGQLILLDWGHHGVRLGCMSATQPKQPKRRTTLLRIRCPGDLRATFDRLSKTTGKTYAALLRDMVAAHTRRAA